MTSITMTGIEIRQLAEACGYTIDASISYDFEDETEMTITEGWQTVEDDDGNEELYWLTAHATDYPEEGVIPLGFRADGKTGVQTGVQTPLADSEIAEKSNA